MRAILLLAVAATVLLPAASADYRDVCTPEKHACIREGSDYEGSGWCNPYERYSYSYNLVQANVSGLAIVRFHTFCESSNAYYGSSGHTQVVAYAKLQGETVGVFWNGVEGSGGFCWIRVTVTSTGTTEHPCPLGMQPPRAPAVIPWIP